MKVPAIPPPFRDIFGEMVGAAAKAGPLALAALSSRTAAAQPVDDKGRYLHWEDFRFKPDEDGLSAAERWALMRRAREARRVETPLTDKTGARFFFVKTDAIERALHDIDSRTRGGVRFDGAAPSESEAQIFLVTSLIEEPFSSSVFEGAVATRDQAKKIINENRPPKTQGERMVLNNYRAIEFIKERKHEPLTTAMILELHRLVTRKTLQDASKEGAFRAPSDNIVVEHPASGDILHTPPDAHELKERAKALCDFANAESDEGPFIHPVIRAIILHFMLAYDHPFVDGNGRTARALFYWSALSDGYWLLEFISISKQIKEASIKYGRAFLETETDDGDLTYFINNQLEMIARAIDALDVFIRRKKAEVHALERLLSSDGFRSRFNHRQLVLINRAARAPGLHITIEQHRATTGVSYLTARADLEGLAGARFLVKRKRGVLSVYGPAPDLQKMLAPEAPR